MTDIIDQANDLAEQLTAAYVAHQRRQNARLAYTGQCYNCERPHLPVTIFAMLIAETIGKNAKTQSNVEGKPRTNNHRVFVHPRAQTPAHCSKNQG